MTHLAIHKKLYEIIKKDSMSSKLEGALEMLFSESTGK